MVINQGYVEDGKTCFLITRGRGEKLLHRRRSCYRMVVF